MGRDIHRQYELMRWRSSASATSVLLGVCFFSGLGCGQDAGHRRVQDCTPSAEETAGTHPKRKKLERLLERAVADGLPGAQMAVDEAGQTWFGAAGVPDLGEPDRRFEVCHQTTIKSITKTFVAVRALQLVDDDVLELDDTLDQLLPSEVLDGLPNTRSIQLRHLLNHTSGIVHYPEVPSYVLEFLNQPDRSHSVAEALDAVRGLEPYSEPGHGYHYSNTNTLLLQHIIERHTGHRLEHELRDNIWQPLELMRTHLHQDEPLSAHVPQGYMDLFGNGDAHQITTLDDVASASGGMESTLLDLVRFSRSLFRDKALVTDATFQEMTDTVATDVDEWGYEASGLGVKRWRTALGPTWGHTGEDTGYKAYWHYAPDHDLTWVLLLNANYGQFATRADELRREVLELLAQKDL